MAIKIKDMSEKERQAYELLQKRSGLFAKLNRQQKEHEEWKEEMLEATDPEYAALKKELRKLEMRSDELKLELRRKQSDALPERVKRVYDKIGANPYKEQLVHRSTGAFIKTGSYSIKEDK